jgi:hypothetical protein
VQNNLTNISIVISLQSVAEQNLKKEDSKKVMYKFRITMIIKIRYKFRIRMSLQPPRNN